MAPVLFDAEALCGSDPPPFPDFNALDVADLIAGRPNAKVTDALKHVAWYLSCECIGAATPPPPVVTPSPDLPVVIPGPLLPCESVTVEYDRSEFLVAEPTYLYGTATAPKPLVAGATSVRTTNKILAFPASGIGAPHAFYIHWFDSAGLHIPPVVTNSIFTDGVTLPPPKQVSASIPATATGWAILFDHGPTSSSSSRGDAQLAVDVFCGAPTRNQPECCPPDPALVAKLDRLELLVNQILEQLGGALGPLEDLGTFPISGEGTLDLIEGTRFVDLELTTLGPGMTTVPYAFPDRLMRAATLRFGNAFGWEKRLHVDAVSSVWPVPAESTRVSWSIAEGGAGTISFLGT